MVITSHELIPISVEVFTSFFYVSEYTHDVLWELVRHNLARAARTILVQTIQDMSKEFYILHYP